MPRIIVITEPTAEHDGVALHSERVRAADLESTHFANQLIERVTWAIADAESAERAGHDETGRLVR